MSGNSNSNQGGGGGGGRGRGRGRRRSRNNNGNNSRDHSPNMRRRRSNELTTTTTTTYNRSRSHENPNIVRSHASSQRRSQSPNRARNNENHHQQRQANQKKTIIHEPEPLTSDTRLAQILADPIPPLIIAFDIENASGTWLGEIWQIGAVCTNAAAAASSSSEDVTGIKQQPSASASASSSFLVNIMPVGTIHWGVTKHCTNVRVNQDQRTGRRCLWHTIRKQELTPACVDPATGLESFLNWIENARQEHFAAFAKMNIADGKKLPVAVDSVIKQLQHPVSPVILMAHGNLDASNLLNNLAAYGLLSRFESLVVGFADSQRYLRNGLTAISDRLFPNETFHAHNALADAQILFHAVHVKRPPPTLPPQHQGDSLSLLPAGRLALVEPLQHTFISTQDAIALTKYKVSKLAQKLPPPLQSDTVRNITALLCVDNVSQLDRNAVFVDAKKREQIRQPPPVVFLLEESSQMSTINISYGSNNTTLVAFDVQFTESTGVRSHIHRICAMELGPEKESSGNNSTDEALLLFDMTCVPPDEVHQVSLSSLVPSESKSHTTREILEQFLNWLTDTRKKCNDNHIVLCSYGPQQRKWPGLLNHLSYHGLEANFASIVSGVCDLALAMSTNQAAVPMVVPAAASAVSSTSNNIRSSNGRNMNAMETTSDFKLQDKAHISFCPNDKNGVPTLHRADEVCQSNRTIAKAIIRNRQSSTDPLSLLLPLLESTITYRSAYTNAQVLLDRSLGADIMAGIHFDGYGEAYKAHRLPRMEALSAFTAISTQT
jgi:hypothetical protein